MPILQAPIHAAAGPTASPTVAAGEESADGSTFAGAMRQAAARPAAKGAPFRKVNEERPDDRLPAAGKHSPRPAAAPPAAAAPRDTRIPPAPAQAPAPTPPPGTTANANLLPGAPGDADAEDGKVIGPRSCAVQNNAAGATSPDGMGGASAADGGTVANLAAAADGTGPAGADASKLTGALDDLLGPGAGDGAGAVDAAGGGVGVGSAAAAGVPEAPGTNAQGAAAPAAPGGTPGQAAAVDPSAAATAAAATATAAAASAPDAASGAAALRGGTKAASRNAGTAALAATAGGAGTADSPAAPAAGSGAITAAATAQDGNLSRPGRTSDAGPGAPAPGGIGTAGANAAAANGAAAIDAGQAGAGAVPGPGMAAADGVSSLSPSDTAAASAAPNPSTLTLIAASDKHAAGEAGILSGMIAGNGDPAAVLSASNSNQAAAAQASAPPPPTLQVHASIDSQDFPQGLSDRVSWMLDNGINGAKLQVNPAQLGPIELLIAVQGDHAQVSMTTHSAVARDALEASSPKLREMLGSQGFGQVSVDISQRSFQDRPSPMPQYQRLPPSARPAAPPSVSAAISPSPRTSAGGLDAYA